MMGGHHRFKSIITKCFLAFAAGIFSVTLVPVIFLTVILPLLCVRFFAIQTAKLNQSLRKPLSITSCHTAIDDIYGKPRCTVVAVFYLTSKLDVDRLLERMAKLLQSDNFPELKQVLARWVCTYFWKECPNFSICNHVIFDPSTDPTDFRQKLEYLVTKPFLENQPLWEIVAFTNYRNSSTSSNSAIAIRIHHSLSDGFALLSLIKSIADPNNNEEVEKHVSFSQSQQEPSGWRKVGFAMKSMCVIPFQTMYEVLQGFDYNQWTRLAERQTGTLIQYEVYEELSQDLLKGAAKSQHKSISSIIFAGFCGAIRKTMIVRHGIESLPETVTVLYPWPRPGHPGTLTNHLICMAIPAPVSVQDEEKRLGLISTEFTSLKMSPLAQGMLMVNLGVGLISGFTKRDVPVRHFGTTILSNFLYSSKPFTFFGSEASHFNVLTGLQSRRVAIMCNTVSYNGRFIVGLKSDSAVLPNRESAELFVKYMIEEFKILERSNGIV